MSATCSYCDQPMDPGTACTMPTYSDFEDGETRARIPKPADDRFACVDCGTPPGALHHPGCDDERCPACGYQAISCGCPAGWDDEEDE